MAAAKEAPSVEAMAAVDAPTREASKSGPSKKSG
jgi:hypothetical protein